MRTVAVSILSIWISAFPTVTEVVAAGQKATSVRGDVLAAVEAELARLSKRAEQEAGPVHPRPSSEVAFLLLTGLAAQGSQVKEAAAGYVA